MSGAPRRISAALIVALVLGGAGTAFALSTYREGTASRPFNVGSLEGGRIVATSGDPAFVPKTAVLWEYKSTTLDPRSVQALANGNVLIASRDSNRVVEVDLSGRVVWSYTTADYQADFDTTDPFLPFAAQRFTSSDGSQHTLVTLRKGDPVFELDENKNVVWHFGTGVAGSGPGQLMDAFSASRLANGNTLIADNQGCRVLEVTPAGAVAWQYGVAGELASDHGYAAGYLGWPRTAQRLDANPSDGRFTTLIADEVGQRVIEVDQAGALVWQYGQNGVEGSGPGQLFNPSAAVRLSDGSTLIVDNPNKVGRVLRIAADKRVLSVYPDPADTPDTGTMGEARSVSVLVGGAYSGSLVIADESNDRVIRVGYQPSAKLTSADLDCGLPGVQKDFLALTWEGTAPAGTTVSMYYSVDDGAWKTAGTAKRVALPASAVGKRIRYRAVITTNDSAAQARVDAISIECAPAADHARTPSNANGASSGSTTSTVTTESSSTAPTPSGAKGSAGGALLSDAGVETALSGPLEAAAGQVLAAGAVSMPGLPGSGQATGETGGTAAALGLTYLLGFAWYPARAGLGKALSAIVRIGTKGRG